MATQHLGRVAFWMGGALLSFSASALAIRALAKQLSIFEILTIRLGFGFLVLLMLAAARPMLRQELLPRHMNLHFARNLVHFIGQYTWSLAVTLLPLATLFALEFTMPAWVAVLAVPMLGERMTRARAISVVLGFLGVLVIVRPGLASFQPAALLVLFAAFMFALSLIATKSLTNRVSTFAVIFWMNTIQLPIALAWPLILAMTDGPPLFVLRMGADMIVPALALGAVGLTSHYCLTNAFRAGDATVVVPMDFLRIPLIALVGWMFYAEPLDAFVFAGALLIIGGISWNLLAESRRLAPKVSAGTETPRSAQT